MTLPSRILLLIADKRPPLDAAEIHFALRQDGQTITLGLVADTLRLMAARGEVVERDGGWVIPAKPVVKQGSLFG